MTLIRVLEIAPKTGNFHFDGGEPQTFIEVDWFRDDPSPPNEQSMMPTEEGRKQITKFIRGKKYYDPNKAYLILHQEHTFTLNYSAP